MGKKTEPAEPKKECPSCGLGVALDATICEFCGWDFEEEDEWILQIEKLERDLILEKQKFEPGTVDQKIEATLRNPAQERVEAAQASAAAGAEKAEPLPAPRPAPQTRQIKQAPSVPVAEKPVRPKPEVAVAPVPRPVERKLASPAPTSPAPVPPRQETPAPEVRRVRTVRPEEPTPAAAQAPAGPKKTRVLRKVKQK